MLVASPQLFMYANKMRLSSLPTAKETRSHSFSLLIASVGITVIGCVITVFVWQLQKNKISAGLMDPHSMGQLIELGLKIQLGFGLAVSTLIGIIFFMLARARRTALLLAEKITTELQETTADLATKKAYLETILLSIGDGVFVIDTEGRIRLCNMAASTLLETSEQDLLMQSYKEIFAVFIQKNEQDEFIQRATSSLTTQEASLNSCLLTKSGNELPINSKATPLLTKDNQTLGTVVVFRDATRERELSKLKDDFVSVASHELRTPLAAIDGLVAMILEGEYGEVNEELRQPLEDVNISSERLINLVNDLLNVSRIQSGRLSYSLSEESLETIVPNVTNLLQTLATEKNIQLIIEPIDSSLVQIDKSKTEEVFHNLIGNALKFTSQGSITISTKATGDTIEVSVKDTGLGIDKKEQHKLFGKFQQVGSIKNRAQGTGLGLYLSRQMVRKMGGDLWLSYSELGKGSVFSFSLPRAGTELAKKTSQEIATDEEAQQKQKSS